MEEPKDAKTKTPDELPIRKKVYRKNEDFLQESVTIDRKLNSLPIKKD